MLTPAQDVIVLQAAQEIFARSGPDAQDWADELSFAVTAVELGGEWVTKWTRDLIDLAHAVVRTAGVRA